MRNILFVLLVVFILPAVMQAHPPKSVDVEFDNETKVLTVKISHFVDNPSKHFIDKIVVELNGDEIITQKLKAQNTKQDQEAQYMITDAAVGDTITVTAYCNISGKKKAVIDVAAHEEEHEEE